MAVLEPLPISLGSFLELRKSPFLFFQLVLSWPRSTTTKNSVWQIWKHVSLKVMTIMHVSKQVLAHEIALSKFLFTLLVNFASIPPSYCYFHQLCYPLANLHFYAIFAYSLSFAPKLSFFHYTICLNLFNFSIDL